MRKNAVLTENKDGALLRVDVTPNAKSTEIFGVNQWRGALQVRVAAQAKEGEANAELVRFLASHFGVPSSDIRIIHGHTSGLKVVQLPVTISVARRLLGVG